MLADRMPDTGYYKLPSCQTVEGVCQTYRQEIMAKGAHHPISQTHFRRMWKNSFSKVVTPKVGLVKISSDVCSLIHLFSSVFPEKVNIP